MSRSAKPRKKRVPRPVRVPMTAGARDELAMKLHAVIAGFMIEPSADLFNRVCTYMAVMGRTVANETRYEPIERERRIKQITSLMLTAESIYQRYDRTGKMTLTETDKAAYRAAAAAVDEILTEISYSTFLYSKDEVYAEMRAKNMPFNL